MYNLIVMNNISTVERCLYGDIVTGCPFIHVEKWEIRAEKWQFNTKMILRSEEDIKNTVIRAHWHNNRPYNSWQISNILIGKNMKVMKTGFLIIIYIKTQDIF